MKFNYIETANWPHPGVDMMRFGVWFSLDGMDYDKLKNKSMCHILPMLVKQLKQQHSDMIHGVG